MLGLSHDLRPLAVPRGAVPGRPGRALRRTLGGHPFSRPRRQPRGPACRPSTLYRARSTAASDLLAIEMKTAIVTGTQGISRAIAEVLAREHGYRGFVLVFRQDLQGAEEAQKHLEATYSAQVVLVHADLASQAGCAAGLSDIFTAVERSFGNQLTALVHSGGCYLPKDDRAFEGYFHLYPRFFADATERALQLMKDGEGKIVAISAIGCNLTMTPIVTYPAGHAKAALEYLVRSYALREGRRKICVNCVIPGVTNTRGWGIPVEEVEALAVKRSPMAAFIQPQDIANAVGFLCSPQACFITGVCLPVDGGMHLGCTAMYD